MPLQIYTNPNLAPQLMMQGAQALGAGIGGGLNKIGEAYGQMQEKKKKESQETSSLRKLLEVRGVADKDTLNSYSLGELRGVHQASVEEEVAAHRAAQQRNMVAESAMREYQLSNQQKAPQFLGELAKYGQEYGVPFSPEHISKYSQPFGLQQFGRAAMETGYNPDASDSAALKAIASFAPQPKQWAPTELEKLQDAERAALSIGDTMGAADFRRRIEKLNDKPKGISLVSPDGTIISMGGDVSEASTMAMKTDALKKLTEYDAAMPNIVKLKNNVRPQDLGIRGKIGSFLDGLAPQLGLNIADLDRADHQTRVKLYHEGLLRLITSDNVLNKEDRAAIERMLGGDTWLDNPEVFKRKLTTIESHLRKKARSAIKRSGIPDSPWLKLTTKQLSSREGIREAMEDKVITEDEAYDLISNFHVEE